MEKEFFAYQIRPREDLVDVQYRDESGRYLTLTISGRRARCYAAAPCEDIFAGPTVKAGRERSRHGVIIQYRRVCLIPVVKFGGNGETQVEMRDDDLRALFRDLRAIATVQGWRTGNRFEAHREAAWRRDTPGGVLIRQADLGTPPRPVLARMHCS